MGWRGPLTHRQFVAWQAWENVEWWRPTLVTKYLQSIAQECRRGWVADPGSVTMKEMELVDMSEMVDELVSFVPRAGGTYLHRIVDKDGNVLSEELITDGHRTR